jgi:hypothetical protein
MRTIFLFAIISTGLTACRSTEKATEYLQEPVVLNQESQAETVHDVRIDTAFIYVPAQSAERDTPCDSSHLETDYAESDAVIRPDGTLHHTLRNKPDNHPVAVASSRDTIRLKVKEEVPVPYPVKEEVERSFTLWEQVRLKTWWLAVMAAAAATAWIFRRSIFKLIHRKI